MMTIEFGSMQTEDVNFNLEVGRYLTAVRNNSAVLDLRNVTAVKTTTTAAAAATAKCYGIN